MIKGEYVKGVEKARFVLKSRVFAPQNEEGWNGFDHFGMLSFDY